MVKEEEQYLAGAVGRYPEGHPDREFMQGLHSLVSEYSVSKRRQIAIDIFEIRKQERELQIARGYLEEQQLLRGTDGLKQVREIVLGVFEVNLEDFLSPNRVRHLVLARKAYSFIVFLEVEDVPLVAISEGMGRTDHSTAAHHINTAPVIMTEDPNFKRNVTRVRLALRAIE